ncbi:hypothetical protein TNCV_2946091 [Trichonephila clavipes]|nr:hypothetical protein TNCV_2946091 [Trichonephila clavipes]
MQCTDERAIGHGFTVAWLPHAPDQTSGYFWLWGYLNSKVFDDRVANLNILKYKISHRARNFLCNLLRAAVKNVVQKMHILIFENGGHIECSS